MKTDRNDAFLIDLGDASFGFQKCLLCPGGAIGIFHNDRSRRQRRFHVAGSVGVVRNDIFFSAQHLLSTRLHGHQRIENPIQRFIVHFDRIHCGVSSAFIHGSDSRDGIPLETYLVDRQQGLIRCCIKVAVFASDVGMRYHGKDTGYLSGFADIQALDARPRVWAV